MFQYNSNFRYSAATVFNPGATPQDVFSITGNATTNVYVCKMGICTLQNADEFNNWGISKRSTANTGGVIVNVAAVPFNSNSPAASSPVSAYTTTAGVDGNFLGYVWIGEIMANVVSPTEDVAGFSGVVVDFESMYGEPISLLSANEVLAWNFGGVAKPAGLTVSAWINWYESYKS